MNLYHYTTEKTALLYLLNTYKLKFGKLKHTNDPRENRAITPTINFTSNFFLNTYENYEDIPLPFNEEQLNVNLHTHFKTQVLCFCTDKKEPKNIFDYGFSKPRMWSQYGENHAGCCLIFDKNHIDIEFKKMDLEKYSGYIKYNLSERNKSFSVNLSSNEKKKDLYMKKLLDSYKKNLNNILFKKSPDWKEEREFRYIIIDPKNTNNFLNISKALRGIILSYNYNKNLDKYLFQKCEDLKIELFRLKWNNGIPTKSDLIEYKKKNLLKSKLNQLIRKIYKDGKIPTIENVSGTEIVNTFKKRYPKNDKNKNELVQIINNYYNIYYGKSNKMDYKQLENKIDGFLDLI